MKLLVDTCVSPAVAADIAAAGHDVVWVGSLPSDPGDEEILSLALEQSRTVVTLDKDFGELAVAFGRPHAGIVRLVALSVRKQAAVCLQVIARHADDLSQGAIITAEPGRLRLRPPPSGVE